ncbi:MAG: aminotransferase [Granulosicoccaceae bacterium]
MSTPTLEQLDKDYALHPYTNLAAHQQQGPFVIAGGDGIHIIDDQGKRYIEGMAGLWCAGLGFSEPRLAEAAAQQFAKLPYSHMFAHRSTEPAIVLSAMLAEIAPEGVNRAFFVNSGSEAVDTAIKLVSYYNNALGRPDKKRIIARQRAYHGVTVAGSSLTGLPYVHGGFDLPAKGSLHADAPHYYRYAQDGESEADYSARLVASLEQMIESEGPDTIGAFIAEPVMGAGGVLIPPTGYFEGVQAILRKHDILMIADEVICGFGRTGEMFGSDRFNIQPDLMTTAKQLSAAYLPIGAILVADRVYNAIEEYSTQFGTFGTGNTYGGHPVAAAVAIETLKIYQERNLIEHVKALEPQFLARLKELEVNPLVGQARGVGLIGAIEIVADKESKEQYPAEAKMAVKVAAQCQQNGLILRPTPGDSVAICPPLTINANELDQLFDRLATSLKEVSGQH